MTALIMVDQDLIVIYVNRAARCLLTKHTTVLSEAFSDFLPNAIVGSCIKRFCKTPDLKKSIFRDPKNLPYKTDISIGNLRFLLNVAAHNDSNGKYIGNTLEWQELTEK